MNEILLEMTLILVLILLNGVFAAAEIAVISVRRGRLQALATDPMVLSLAEARGILDACCSAHHIKLR